MNVIGGLIGGVLGAVLGAVIWAVVGYYTQYEIGWIAWGIGALVGFGVRAGNKGEGNPAAGMLAVVLALAGIAAGKVAVIWVAMDESLTSDETVISCFADDILAERAEAGKPVRFTPPSNSDTLEEDYPRDVWMEARQRFNALGPEKQAQVRKCPPSSYEKWIVMYIADSLIMDMPDQGRSLEWPEEANEVDFAYREAHYPAQVWAEAQGRWDAMGAAEQETYYAQAIDFSAAQAKESLAEFKKTYVFEAIKQSLSAYDILWAGLAIATAFRLGASGKDEAKPAAA